MPLYNYNCKTCGVIELLRPMSASEDAHAECPTCHAQAERIAELAAMRPDSMWHFGQYVAGHGQVNSSSKLARINRDNHIVTLDGQNDIDAMKKLAAEGRKAKEEKRQKETRKVFEEGFAGSGIVNSFGEPTPDAVKQW